VSDCQLLSFDGFQTFIGRGRPPPEPPTSQQVKSSTVETADVAELKSVDGGAAEVDDTTKGGDEDTANVEGSQEQSKKDTVTEDVSVEAKQKILGERIKGDELFKVTEVCNVSMPSLIQLIKECWRTTTPCKEEKTPK
jgi:hypothetical protein